ncbi:MAG: hypothetical protein ACR2MF_11140 [Chthoniobacterales bacterium]
MTDNLPRGGRGIFLGLSFIVGMGVFALLLGHAIRSAKRMDEAFHRDELSEREVASDLAAWPISFTYMSKPQFLFTGLNRIKTDMIQEANRAARQADEVCR